MHAPGPYSFQLSSVAIAWSTAGAGAAVILRSIGPMNGGEDGMGPIGRLALSTTAGCTVAGAG